MNRKTYLASLLAIFTLALVSGLVDTREVESVESRLFNESIVREVYDIIRQSYVEEDSPELDRKLFYGAMRGMTDALDPYSSFMTPEERKELEIETQGRFGGLGILVEKPTREGPVVVVTPFLGTPASAAGILPGDRIIAIDGESTFKMALDEAVSRMRGPRGTKIKLEIQHAANQDSRAYAAGRLLAGSRVVSVDGRDVTTMRESDVFNLLNEKRGEEVHVVVVPEMLAQPKEVELMRDEIVVPNIEFKRLIDRKHGIGYIHLARFQEDTARKLAEAIDELRAGGMKSLVLDLRGNGGGLLQAAIRASSLFLDRGQIIVSTRPRQEMSRDAEGHIYRQRFNPPYPKDSLPLAVIVDGSSASAAEILAAALGDNGRGTVVGMRSFGKASVQKLFDIGLGRDPESGRRLDGWLKLTTERYYTPNGKSIHREPDSETWGVQPERVVEMDESQLYEVRRRWERDRLAEHNVGVDLEDGESLAEVDPQLAQALDVLRGGAE